MNYSVTTPTPSLRSFSTRFTTRFLTAAKGPQQISLSVPSTRKGVVTPTHKKKKPSVARFLNLCYLKHCRRRKTSCSTIQKCCPNTSSPPPLNYKHMSRHLPLHKPRSPVITTRRVAIPSKPRLLRKRRKISKSSFQGTKETLFQSSRRLIESQRTQPRPQLPYRRNLTFKDKSS